MADDNNQPVSSIKKVRVGAVADIHCSRHSEGLLNSFLPEISKQADIVLFCGDITDYGLEEEARIFAKKFSEHIRMPALAVLGNHDFEAGKQNVITRMLEDVGIEVLDGGTVEIEGIGFAGVKGFAGGFGSRELQPWGESGIKKFVHESVEESLKLEAALSRLCTRQKFALLHYSPIEQTIRGEPLEIYPFLGSSRLEEALNRFDITAAFHGHAHFGTPEGKTSKGIPVYNVALPLLKRTLLNQPPLKIITVEVSEEQAA